MMVMITTMMTILVDGEGDNHVEEDDDDNGDDGDDGDDDDDADKERWW
jgi:hypothetical protein